MENSVENDSLLMRYDQQGRPPADRCYGVLSIFFVLGCGSLLPWNFFMNAKQYFMYKLRDTNVTGDVSWKNASFYDDNQKSYESYLAVAAMVPAVVFMLVNVLISKRVSAKARIMTSLATMIAMFILTVIATQLNTDSWQDLFLILSLVSVTVMNSASAMLQGASCGLAGCFPKVYMQAVMTGQGLGGVLASIASIVTISFGIGPVKTGFAYFLIALVVLLVSLLVFSVLSRLEYYNYHVPESASDCSTGTINRVDGVDDVDGGDDEGSSVVSVRRASLSTLTIVLKKVWLDGLSVFLVFAVTLSCFPAVNSLIQPISTQPSAWTNFYFVPVTCFLLFNVSDFGGRCVSGFLLWPKQSSRKLFLFFAVLRIAFIPVFLLSNIVIPDRRFPTVFHNDAVPIIAECLLGFSNGYLITLAMMYAPRRVATSTSETAGALMSFFLAIGLGSGALVSVLLVKFCI